MESSDHHSWPVEMLGRILHFLAMDGASIAWQRFAYLTLKSSELKVMADRMQRPLVLRVGFDGNGETRFNLPFYKATVAQIEIDWGDDTPTQKIETVGAGFVEHQYKPEGGEYTVRVFPLGPTGINGVWLDHLGFAKRVVDGGLGNQRSWWRPLRSLDTLGSLGITSLENAFSSASGFNKPLAHLDVSKIENMVDLFYEATSFNQDLSRWNVSRVKSMTRLFCGARSFNQPIGDWDVGSVTCMNGVFFYARSFNQPLERWNVSRVTNMCNLFSCTSEFNQDISSWNVASVTDMSHMFDSALSFNQPIGSWSVSSVQNMSNMFYGARVFNQPIGSWDVSSVTDMSSMFTRHVFQ